MASSKRLVAPVIIFLMITSAYLFYTTSKCIAEHAVDIIRYHECSDGSFLMDLFPFSLLFFIKSEVTFKLSWLIVSSILFILVYLMIFFKLRTYKSIILSTFLYVTVSLLIDFIIFDLLIARGV